MRSVLHIASDNNTLLSQHADSVSRVICLILTDVSRDRIVVVALCVYLEPDFCRVQRERRQIGNASSQSGAYEPHSKRRRRSR